MNNALQKARDRLESLIKSSAEVTATRRVTGFGATVDQPMYMTWRTSSLTTIKNIAPGSHFETDFLSFEENAPGFAHRFENQLAILKALLDDLDGGLLVSLKGLIRAEVFGDLLDQAQHLLEEGYWQPAAVVAGAVLEEHLRKLCAKHASISLPAKPKLDTMNTELAKAGEYNLLEQKRITFLADIRNKAAHGRWAEFTSADSKDLIESVLRFVVNHPL